MADGSWSSDLPNIPSWAEYAIGAQSIVAAGESDDPEDALMVQLLLSELALFAFGLALIGRLFPELMPQAERMGVKLKELSMVQQYFENEEDDSE